MGTRGEGELGRKEERGRGETRRWTAIIGHGGFLEILKQIIMLLQLQHQFHQDE